jgi:hypothetical protein
MKLKRGGHCLSFTLDWPSSSPAAASKHNIACLLLLACWWRTWKTGPCGTAPGLIVAAGAVVLSETVACWPALWRRTACGLLDSCRWPAVDRHASVRSCVCLPGGLCNCFHLSRGATWPSEKKRNRGARGGSNLDHKF